MNAERQKIRWSCLHCAMNHRYDVCQFKKRSFSGPRKSQFVVIEVKYHVVLCEMAQWTTSSPTPSRPTGPLAPPPQSLLIVYAASSSFIACTLGRLCHTLYVCILLMYTVIQWLMAGVIKPVFTTSFVATLSQNQAQQCCEYIPAQNWFVCKSLLAVWWYYPLLIHMLQWKWQGLFYRQPSTHYRLNVWIPHREITVYRLG